jgi:hypothetical protein
MKRSTKIRICHQGASMLFYPAALPLSSQTLTYSAGVIRRHRKKIGSAWRKLNPGRQALLVLAYLRKGDTFATIPPASAPTPSSRTGTSCANSAAAPGAPGSSPRPSTSSKPARSQDENAHPPPAVSVLRGEDQLAVEVTFSPPLARPLGVPTHALTRLLGSSGAPARA